MNVAIACGGTGGHLFPGLAVAEVLRYDGDLEARLEAAGIDGSIETRNRDQGLAGQGARHRSPPIIGHNS